MQAIMFARKPGLPSEYALSVGKCARTYHYQHRQENTPRDTHAQSNRPWGEQPQRQRVTSHNQVDALQSNRDTPLRLKPSGFCHSYVVAYRRQRAWPLLQWQAALVRNS